MENEKTAIENCRFCGKEFKPQHHLFDNLSRYLCNNCHDLVKWEVKHCIAESLMQIGIIPSPRKKESSLIDTSARETKNVSWQDPKFI